MVPGDRSVSRRPAIAFGRASTAATFVLMGSSLPVLSLPLFRDDDAGPALGLFQAVVVVRAGPGEEQTEAVMRPDLPSLGRVCSRCTGGAGLREDERVILAVAVPPGHHRARLHPQVGRR